MSARYPLNKYLLEYKADTLHNNVSGMALVEMAGQAGHDDV